MFGEVSFNAVGESTGELKGDPEIGTVTGVEGEVDDAVVDNEEGKNKPADDVPFGLNRWKKDVDEVSYSSWSRVVGTDVSGLPVSIIVSKCFSVKTILGKSKSTGISWLGVEVTSDPGTVLIWRSLFACFQFDLLQMLQILFSLAEFLFLFTV